MPNYINNTLQKILKIIIKGSVCLCLTTSLNLYGPFDQNLKTEDVEHMQEMSVGQTKK
jgi:hypothetical protein